MYKVFCCLKCLNFQDMFMSTYKYKKWQSNKKIKLTGALIQKFISQTELRTPGKHISKHHLLVCSDIFFLIVHNGINSRIVQSYIKSLKSNHKILSKHFLENK